LGTPGELPFIDEFDALVDAPAGEVFKAVTKRVARSANGSVARAVARILGCVHRGSYTVPFSAGQEANGFRVAEVAEPKRLVLEGRHRFATYRLSFLIEPLGERRVVLRARTDAFFPGWSGKIYRGLVIGTGAHEILVKKMLAAIARQADPPRSSA
jgi:hypothetical protein